MSVVHCVFDIVDMCFQASVEVDAVVHFIYISKDVVFESETQIALSVFPCAPRSVTFVTHCIGVGVAKVRVYGIDQCEVLFPSDETTLYLIVYDAFLPLKLGRLDFFTIMFLIFSDTIARPKQT